MQKNVAGQYLIVQAYDKTTGQPKDGDAANITAAFSLDGGSFVASNDTNPTELTLSSTSKGRYKFDLTQAETNCNLFYAIITSATENIVIDDVSIETEDRTTAVTLAASQPNYAPSKAGDAMTLTSAYDAAKSAAAAADMATALSSLTTLLTRLSAARAGYMDNLNVGGLLASQADVAAITQAQRVRIALPMQMERPDADSTTYRIYIYAYNELHQAEDLDSNPTVTAENNTGTDRSGNLGTVTKPAGTGVYYVDYTVASTHAIEGLLFKVTATEGTVATQYATASIVVDNTAVDFTSGDRSKLESIYGKLPDGGIAKTGEYDEGLDSILAGVLEGNATLASVVLLASTLSKLQQADIKLDTTTTPWTEKYFEKGTATLLMTKVLYDENGDGITSIDSYIGRRMHS